ncbi:MULTISPECIES: hypothetical protein [Streptomyces]|uniref:hypothetical protein n=1 Tax=Streptomyces TaxID=1883 RepID=UPI002A831032|nr:hypothetical protein [Streptomyces sp. S399]WPR54204.1 hypothetical protein SJI45_27530 [Streptomyces sp. S399]
MNFRKKPLTAALTCATLAGTALLVGCQSRSDAKTDDRPTATEKPHGYVAGAEETSEQQSRLVLADGETGEVRVLDLITEDVTPLKRVSGVGSLRTDGRFAYLGSGDSTHIVDTGAWMVDHGDHVHYYRAEIRDVGTVEGKEITHVSSDPAVTAMSSSDGGHLLFDRKELEGGALPKADALTGAADGSVVPYKEHLLVTAAGSGQDAVEVRDREGGSSTTLEESCAEVSGEAVTRRGVVFGCADGALLVSEEKGGFTAEKIPYGTKVDAQERAAGFHHRAGSTTLTATSGDDAVWVLDVTERAWTRIETGPVTAVNTAGEGAPLLALGEDGRLTAYDIETKKATDHKKLMSESGASASIEVDTTRAYVNDAAARKVHEIDYNDHLRVARTFPLDFAPTHMVETGR